VPDEDFMAAWPCTDPADSTRTLIYSYFGKIDEVWSFVLAFKLTRSIDVVAADAAYDAAPKIDATPAQAEYLRKWTARHYYTDRYTQSTVAYKQRVGGTPNAPTFTYLPFGTTAVGILCQRPYVDGYGIVPRAVVVKSVAFDVFPFTVYAKCE
jgi:hypothetical protein